ncbi:xanthine dehydrogenase family protein subunit M [Fervidibacter sacchari]|uniref:Carbon-monoxide dehydrogenase medium subunit n=1 Tax=Candidatus Fervidibacter sacchari TaxID=1448929 RepID=A0ABT2EMB8_9BACT|nr:xanthine dehydrogenase family protein subunit M [Candidatus Fervidibacter sacchari]MCS3918070.1 carbon-monoxide dehydrogenase medium subunit [Candidatus Fervidibacter sacchari]WKU15880.1 xanthine dehydrogenase family protein subunit M [Candidatus Fervidibacter sacchari]
MHWFDYCAPKRLEEALDIFAEYGERARALAGGTDLILFMEKGRLRPELVVEVPSCPPFVGVEMIDSYIRIGSRTTMMELETSPLVREKISVLADAASKVGSLQIRNLATIGGNICTASPAGDTLPALLVLDASVRLVSNGGERLIPLREFFLGPGETVRQADELLTEVIVPIPPYRSGCSFYKLSVRRYMDIAIVNAAAFVSVNEDGFITDAKIALGSVAPTPIRAYEAEERLKGNSISDILLDEVGKLAQEASSPITDQRGTAEYRRIMVYRLTKRVVKEAYERALAQAQA